MKAVLVKAHKLLQNSMPFLGKIVFTLKSTNPTYVSSSIPEEGIFLHGYAFAKLIPNTCLGPHTYYLYQIYAQGHTPGVYLSDVIEEGYCFVPQHDCLLENIIIPLPGSTVITDDQTYDIATDLDEMRYILNEIRTIKTQLLTVQNNTETSANAALTSVQTLTPLVTSAQNLQSELNTISNRISNQLSTFEETASTNVQNQITLKLNEALQVINQEKLLVQDLINLLQSKFQVVEQYSSYLERLAALETLVNQNLNTLSTIQQNYLTEADLPSVSYALNCSEDMSETNLTVTTSKYGQVVNTNNISLNCLVSWVSDELSDRDTNISIVNNKVDAIQDFTGATVSNSGSQGLVPAPSISDRNLYLKGNGTWSELSFNLISDGYIDSLD